MALLGQCSLNLLFVFWMRLDLMGIVVSNTVVNILTFTLNERYLQQKRADQLVEEEDVISLFDDKLYREISTTFVR